MLSAWTPPPVRGVVDAVPGRGTTSGWMVAVNAPQPSVVILGGGPGGYEAALVAAQLGADVTVVDRDGLGGAAVLTDCVPSKALISTADFRSQFETASDLGLHLEMEPERPVHVSRAPGLPLAPVAVMVRQYVPPTADLWRLGAERRPELRLQTELAREPLQIPDVL